VCHSDTIDHSVSNEKQLKSAQSLAGGSRS
jgi:hypothetical protein